ncbi:glutamine amidotransferase-related protein [Teichococcus oryzae]|uniref:Type 1 glutamine amidotransferase n=1 Tax=Teichococcus oryzae TaxID=1608942 RepID=A0A5B2TET2_9PROT|nr:gamma-glutamyl-gamma-aminobutyrate hydrolase family protein [Pseudoroseomonas oryzae]KAA2212535.1 type 1 glutamine amidotransferase [Pseudoroseomonas oryzae]
MPEPFRFLVAESESPEDREARRASAGRSSGETYADTLRALAPGAICDQVKPAEESAPAPDAAMIARYDAVFLCGSPLHVYSDTPETRRLLGFMRAVFAAGAPAFGSCAGLQVAAAAAGGQVGARKQGQEAGFARRITATAEGRAHPLLAGRPAAFDAPAIHSDEVTRLPPGATLLATSDGTPIQAAEIRHGAGVFWGVQYHPELSLREVAEALRRQSEGLVRGGLARDGDAVERHAAKIEALAADPGRRDLAWQLGLDRQVTEAALRRTELRNFIRHLAEPRRARRCAARPGGFP